MFSLPLQDLDVRAVITNVFFVRKIEVLGPVKSQISCDVLYQACTRQKVLLGGILSLTRSWIKKVKKLNEESKILPNRPFLDLWTWITPMVVDIASNGESCGRGGEAWYYPIRISLSVFSRATSGGARTWGKQNMGCRREMVLGLLRMSIIYDAVYTYPI